MFEVKIDGEIYTVYAVEGLEFLIYDTFLSTWQWVEMQKTTPVIKEKHKE